MLTIRPMNRLATTALLSLVLPHLFAPEAHSQGIKVEAISALAAMAKTPKSIKYDGLGISTDCFKVKNRPEDIYLCAAEKRKYNPLSNSYIVIYNKEKYMIVASPTGGPNFEPCKNDPEITLFYDNNPKNRDTWEPSWHKEADLGKYLGRRTNFNFIKKEIEIYPKIIGGYNRIHKCFKPGDNYVRPNDSYKNEEATIKGYLAEKLGPLKIQMPWNSSLPR